MNLTTADRYMRLFSEAKSQASDQNYVAALEMRIASVSRNVERYMNRGVEVKERTERFSPTNGTGTKSVRVSAFPISAVDSVSISGEALDSSLYVVDMESGVISFVAPIMRDIAVPYENCIEVVYTGGMSSNTAGFIADFPDIEMEILTQIRFEIMRVKDIAMKSVANGQTTSQLNAYGMLDSLAIVLDRYKAIGSP